MNLHQFLDRLWARSIVVGEKVVAAAVMVGVVMYGIRSAAVLFELDWSQTATFYELIHRVLAVIIGLELVRMLVSHTIASVLELLAFVIARKMLNPDLASFEVLLGVGAFVGLMAARHFFTEAQFLHNRRDSLEERS